MEVQLRSPHYLGPPPVRALPSRRSVLIAATGTWHRLQFCTGGAGPEESRHPPTRKGARASTPLALWGRAPSCVVLGWAGGESETPTEAANPEHPGPPSVPCPVLGPPPTQCRKAGGNGLGLTQVPPIAGHGVATRPHSSTPGGPREPTQRSRVLRPCVHT